MRPAKVAVRTTQQTRSFIYMNDYGTAFAYVNSEAMNPGKEKRTIQASDPVGAGRNGFHEMEEQA